jgi:hypothetical protein
MTFFSLSSRGSGSEPESRGPLHCKNTGEPDACSTYRAALQARSRRDSIRVFSTSSFQHTVVFRHHQTVPRAHEASPQPFIRFARPPLTQHTYQRHLPHTSRRVGMHSSPRLACLSLSAFGTSSPCWFGHRVSLFKDEVHSFLLLMARELVLIHSSG